MKISRKPVNIILILSILIIIPTIILHNVVTGETAKAETSGDNAKTAVTGRTADITDYLEKTDLKGYTIIMHTNDTHGRVSPNASKKQMGFAAVSALKKMYEAAGAQVILLDAGDTLHGTAFAKKGSGKRIVAVMNLIGYDAMVPGNNDFNYGVNALLKREAKMKFALISSNITYKKNKEDFLQDHIIIKKNGVNYGIFGLTTTDTVLKEDPKDIKPLKFHNPVTAAQKEVKELKSEGAQVIIALAHLGVDDKSEYTSKSVAKEVSGIDLIVDGHSHTALKNGLKEGTTLIVSAGKYLEHIGVVTIDPAGRMKAELVNSDNFSAADPEVDKLIAGYSKKKH